MEQLHHPGGSGLIDVVRARAETPGCGEIAHFNSAGAALMPAPVVEAVTGHFEREVKRGGYEAAEAAGLALEQAYDNAAALLGCGRDEIAFVENATRAWDMIFYSLPFQEGDRILTSAREYPSNYLALLQMAKRTGARIEVIPNGDDGDLSLDALRAAIDRSVKLIALTHIASDHGQVSPAAEVGTIARESGTLFLLDACQSVGQIPVDVAEIGCDFLVGTGRKFLRGPRGTGFLYARRDTVPANEPPFIDLKAARWLDNGQYAVRPDALRFENWETNVAGKLGLSAALAYAQSWGLEAIRTRIDRLATVLREGLHRVPGVAVQEVHGTLSGIVTFTVAGREAQDVRDQLAASNIFVWYLGRGPLAPPDQRDESIVRASVHYYNTDDEIGSLCDAIRDLGG